MGADVLLKGTLQARSLAIHAGLHLISRKSAPKPPLTALQRPQNRECMSPPAVKLPKAIINVPDYIVSEPRTKTSEAAGSVKGDIYNKSSK